MSRTETFACAGCARRFLTASARRRHYEWNPNHADATDAESTPGERNAAAAPRPDADATTGVGDRWVEFDDRFETFLTFDGPSDRIDLEYRPDEGVVVVERPAERRIDVSAVRALTAGRLRWTFDGTYLTLAFPAPT